MALEAKTFDAIHPAWRDRLRGLASEGGYGLSSVWRSRTLQARFRRCYEQRCRGPERGCHGVPGNCPGANLPGRSNHEYEEDGVPAALAVDLYDARGDDFRLAHHLGPKYGIHFPITRERWHAEPNENPGGGTFMRSPFPPVASFAPPAPPPDPWAGFFVPVLAS